MLKYTILPMFNINDPKQTVNTAMEARRLAEDFLAKFGGEDCREMAVVEIRVVGYVEYARPIWHDVNEPEQTMSIKLEPITSIKLDRP